MSNITPTTPNSGKSGQAAPTSAPKTVKMPIIDFKGKTNQEVFNAGQDYLNKGDVRSAKQAQKELENRKDTNGAGKLNKDINRADQDRSDGFLKGLLNKEERQSTVSLIKELKPTPQKPTPQKS